MHCRWLGGLPLIAVAMVGARAAEVTTDGSLGAAVSLRGTALVIGEDLGRRRGDNLFHSLSRLGIGDGDSVLFTGAADIEHVITRITDSEPTRIGGTLASNVGNAGFWLVSPAGITLGPGARIDVPGAFHLAAGAAVNFADGSIWQALDGSDSVLSVAAPESFGLLGAQGSLRVAGARIDGNGLIELASANELSLQQDTRIRIEGDGGGMIRLIGGSVRIEDQAQIAVVNNGDAPALGGIDLRTGQLEISDRGQILATSRAAGSAGDISLTGESLRVRDRGLIASSTTGDGMAGRVVIQGGDLIMTGNGNASRSARISSSSEGRGLAGGVDIRLSGGLSLADAARITSNATATGDAGEIRIDAASIELRSEARLSSSGNRLERALGGAGGRITLTADSISLRNAFVRTQSEKLSGDIVLALRDGQGEISIAGSQGQVTSETFSSGGAAGTIHIEGGDGVLRLSDRGRLSVIARGDASGGMIDVVIGELEMHDRSFISATTEGRGDGGAIRLAADKVTLLGSGDPQRSPLIASSTQGRGDAGGVMVTLTDRLELRDGGRITSNATDRGDGGRIEITAPAIMLDGDARISSSGNRLRNALGGAGGEIILSANDFIIDDAKIRTESEKLSGAIRLQPLAGDAARIRIAGAGGEISSATFSSGGRAGRVSVDAAGGEITLADGGSINAVNRGSATGGEVVVRADRLEMRGQSQITTTTEGRRNAGTVTVEVGELAILGNAGDRQSSPLISSSSTHRGDAGFVRVDAVRVVSLQDGGRITSNSTDRGRSGDVSITAADFRMSGNSAVSSSGNPRNLGGSGDAGSVSIQAGNIRIDDSTVRTEAANAIGGRLTVSAQDRLFLNHATIVTDGLRSADGSSLITLAAGRFLVVNDSRVFSRIADLDGGLTPQALGNTGIANLLGGQITISADSDLQATFGLNITGQENEAGSGLKLPANAFSDVGRLLDNSCGAGGDRDSSSFQRQAGVRLAVAPTGFLGATGQARWSQTAC